MAETKKYQEEKLKVSAVQTVLTALYVVSFSTAAFIFSQGDVNVGLFLLVF